MAKKRKKAKKKKSNQGPKPRTSKACSLCGFARQECEFAEEEWHRPHPQCSHCQRVMASAAPDFLSHLPTWHRRCEIQVTPQRGRVLVAKETITVGEKIFEENPFVSSNWHQDRCMVCNAVHPSSACPQVAKRFPASASLTTDLDDLALQLSELEVIGDVDRARLFLKCLLVLAHDPQPIDESHPLKPLTQLMAADIPSSLACVEEAFALPCMGPLAHACPDHKQVAELLGILNTNSHELPHVGSGVFLTASMMEHACRPNCTFATDGNHLWLMSIAEVPSGTPLTIDYQNMYYHPTHQRQQALLTSQKNFLCLCEACTVQPDLCRAFHCTTCWEHTAREAQVTSASGIVCPTGRGDQAGQWKCETCGVSINGAVLAEWQKAEAQVEAAPPTSLEQVLAVAAKGPLHLTHWLLWTQLETLGRELAGSCRPADCQAAKQVWSLVLFGAERVLPRWHDEHVVMQDVMAQICVRDGDHEGAKAAYGRAYQVSTVTSGPASRATEDLKRLWQRPPRTVEELLTLSQETELMAALSAEGDEAGLAELQRLKREHLGVQTDANAALSG